MRIALVNMPFAALATPSLGLTQLDAVLRKRLGGRVSVETHYLNLPFAEHFGSRRQYEHALSGAGFLTGVGDWLFRQAAFPGAPDNADAYLERYYFTGDTETRALRKLLLEKRAGLTEWLDACLAARRLADADLVGFTTLFGQTVASFAMAARLKRANPRIITAIGGAACMGEMGQEFARQVPQMDYVFSGPALESFPAVINHLLDGNRAACDRVRGVFSKTNAALWQTEEEARRPDAPPPDVAVLGRESDINENLLPDYEPFFAELARAAPSTPIRPVLLFETSRGCSWAERCPCTFCGLNALKLDYHALAPAEALRQIRSLFQWLPRASSFIAVDTIMPREYPRAVFPVLGAPEGMKMMYEVRATLPAKDLATLCAAGVVALQPGIEALATSTLKLMRKGTTAFQNLRFLKACSGLPVSLDWNLLICSPGEAETTYEKYLRDLPMLAHLAPPSGVYPINFARYSLYHRDPAAYGLELEPHDFCGLTYPFDAAALRRVAYHFVDRNADAARADRWLGVLNEQVAHWRERWLGRDERPQARLCLVRSASPPAVYDSRDGTEREHALSALALRVLESLEQPKDLAGLQQAIPEAASDALRQEIGALQQQGLLFEEAGRYLSLVIDAP